MINVTLRLREFMEALPVGNAEVTVIVKVVPRWFRSIPIRTVADYLKLDLPAWSKLSARLVVDPVESIEGQVAAMPMSEDFTQQGTSAADGTFRASFDVGSAFERQRLQVDEAGERPSDVVAVLNLLIRVPWLGLSRVVEFYRGLTQEAGEDLLGEDADVYHTIAIDLAKVIVGHTTPNSALLWVQRARHDFSRELLGV